MGLLRAKTLPNPAIDNSELASKSEENDVIKRESRQKFWKLQFHQGWPDTIQFRPIQSNITPNNFKNNFQPILKTAKF